MSLDPVRLLAHVHGHLGWLVVAALSHPAVLLRKVGRRAPLATTLATATTLVTAVIGAAIYPRYREVIKPTLFVEHPSLGWAFERKEHLAVFAAVFALSGWIAHRAADARPELAPLAQRAYVVALGCSVVAATIGVLVAAARSF